MAKGTDTLSQIGGGALGTLALIDAAHSGNLFQVLAQRQHLLQDPAFRASLVNSPFAAGQFFVGGHQQDMVQPTMRSPGVDMVPAGAQFQPNLPALNPQAALGETMNTELNSQLADPGMRSAFVRHKLGIPLTAPEAQQAAASLMAQLPPGTTMHPSYKIGPDGGITIALSDQPDLATMLQQMQQMNGSLVPTGFAINPHGGATTTFGLGPEATRTQQQDANAAAGQKRLGGLLARQKAAATGQPEPPTTPANIGYPPGAPAQMPDFTRAWGPMMAGGGQQPTFQPPPAGLPSQPIAPSGAIPAVPTELPISANIAGVTSVFPENKAAVRGMERKAQGLQNPVNTRLTALAEMTDAASYLRDLSHADPAVIAELIGPVDLLKRKGQFSAGTLPEHLKDTRANFLQAIATLKRFLFTEAGKRVTGPELEVLMPLFPDPRGADPAVFRQQNDLFLKSVSGRLATELAGQGAGVPDQYRAVMDKVLARANTASPEALTERPGWLASLGYDLPSMAGGMLGGLGGGMVGGLPGAVAGGMGGAAAGSAANRFVRQQVGARTTPESSVGSDALMYGAVPEAAGPIVSKTLAPIAEALGNALPWGMGKAGGAAASALSGGLGRALTPTAGTDAFAATVAALSKAPSGLSMAGRSALRNATSPAKFLAIFDNPEFASMYHSAETRSAMSQLSTQALKLISPVERANVMALRAGLRLPGFVAQAPE